MKQTKQLARLENWDYFGGRLLGQVYGHPRFAEGEEVQTSTVLSPPDMVRDNETVETRNTIYKLGNRRKEKQDGK